MMNHNSEVRAKQYRLKIVNLAELERQRKIARRDSSNDVESLEQ